MKKLMKSFSFFCLLWLGIQVSGFAQQAKDSGYFKSFDGTSIYYESIGSGVPVVLVHGFIVNGESWKRTNLYQELLRLGYKVITMDLRGNGRSDKPHVESAYDNDAESRDLMGLLKFLNVGPYHIVGYSRGSIIVARMLVLDSNIRSATLGGMGLDFTNPNWPRRIAAYNAMSGQPSSETRGMIEYARKTGLDTVALAYLQKYQPSTPVEKLATITKPILVIHGEEDEDNGSALALSKAFPIATYQKVPGVHNNAHHSREFADAVIGFIDRQKARN